LTAGSWTASNGLGVERIRHDFLDILAEVNPRVPRRGDIWSVQFDERRRVVLLTSEEESTFRSIQLVDPAGQDISGLAIEVSVGIEEGLPFEEVVRFAFSRPGLTPCTWLANLGREDLMEWIGALSEVKMGEIDDALASAGLDPVTVLSGVA
jgi:mRNA interferase MazF